MIFKVLFLESGVAGAAGSSAPAWLFALLGMGAVAFGIGGVAAARYLNDKPIKRNKTSNNPPKE